MTAAGSKTTLASVVVNNFNYGRFIGDAIESALAQSWPAVEVIVVDDGSTDGSREVIASFDGRVLPILKENGGQASSFNAGFAASSGDVVVFLDADDVLESDAVARGIEVLSSESAAVHVQWPLLDMDERGQLSGRLWSDLPLDHGDLSSRLLRDGPFSLGGAPTSGNMWTRALLLEVLPAPTSQFAICADAYLHTVASLYGEVALADRPLSRYRRHSANNTPLDVADRMRMHLAIYDACCDTLREHCSDLGLAYDARTWTGGNWQAMLRDAVLDISSVVPGETPFVLIDDDKWGAGLVDGRPSVPFPERDGEWWGPPAADDTAIDELERLQASGVSHLVVAWTSFWWLDHYPTFFQLVRDRHQCLLSNERVVVFSLRSSS